MPAPEKDRGDERARERERPATKRQLAEESTGDEVGGERSGRGAPTEHPEQFEEYVDDGGAGGR